MKECRNCHFNKSGIGGYFVSYNPIKNYLSHFKFCLKCTLSKNKKYFKTKNS